MIFVVFGICFLAAIIGQYFQRYYDFDEIGLVMSVVGAIGAVVSIVVCLILGICVSKQGVVDDTIAMYIEENTKIEEQVNVLVDEFMDHESDVYSDAKVTSPIVLAQLYPEIKSDELIKSQIDIYVANNEQIKSLKLQKINGSVYRWWLYFGK